jgi:hypothetical protein
MNRMWMRGAVGLCSLMLCVALTKAQEKKPGTEPKKPDAAKPDQAQKPEPPKGEKPSGEKGQPGQGGETDEMMKKCMEYGTPGEAHKRLEPMVGKWEYEFRWWMGPEQAEPEVSKGASEMKWIFDGRFIQQDVTGPAEGPEGKPFKGQGLYGYDNVRKEYVSIWFDNMSTGMLVAYGKWDEAAKAITMGGEAACPMTGNLHQKFRTVTKWDGNDKCVYTHYSLDPAGKEFKTMEITYTRAK